MKTYETKNYKLVITEDSDVFDFNPRTENDNLCTMAFFHPRYNLGDTTNINSKDYNSWGEMKNAIEKKHNGVLVLPVYLYDHSGITISLDKFSCPWDSGQIGFIFTTREALLKEYSVKRITAKIKAKAFDVMKGEMKIYDLYLRGEVYGYELFENTDTDNNIDSCFGFYGSDIHSNGMFDNLCEEFRNEYNEESKAKNIVPTIS